MITYKRVNHQWDLITKVKKYSVQNLAQYWVLMLEFQILNKYWEQNNCGFRHIYNLIQRR
jgi:hypothetical protein